MKRRHYSALGIIIAGSCGLASADGLAEKFEYGYPTGIRPDEKFRSEGVHDIDHDPGSQGDKEGIPVQEPVGYVVVIVESGYDSNPYLWDSGFENSAFFAGFGLRSATIVTDPTYSAYFGGAIGGRYYEFDDPELDRDGSDNFIYDLDLRAGFTSDITETIKFNSFTRVNFGGTGNAKLDYLYPAILDQNVLRLESNARFDYRFDGLPTGTNGLEFSTNSEFLGFYGAEWSYADFSRVGVTQDVAYNVNPDTRVALRSHLSCSHYDDSFFDSENFRLGGLVEGVIGERLEYRAEAGYEWRSYDAAKIEDRNMLYLRGVLNGEVSNNVFVSSIVSYGTEDLYNNFFGSDFYQPDVVRLEGRITAQLGNYRVRGQLGAAKFDGDIFGSDHDITQITTGVGVDTEVNAYRLGASLEHSWGERDFGGDIDYDQTKLTFSVQTTF